MAAEILDLSLHADLFLEVQEIVRVGVDRYDAGKAARTDGDAEGAALPKFFIVEGRRRFSRRLPGLFRRQTPALAPRVSYRLAAPLKGLIFRLFLRYRTRQCGKIQWPPLFIEDIYFLQAVHRADFVKQ